MSNKMTAKKETTTTAVSTEFLPQGYKLPDKSKQFMKLEVGDNVIRVLSTPLLGYIVFNNENKPIRRGVELGDFTLDELQELGAKKNDKGEFEGSRHFWLMLVWSKKDNAPKILEITQITILKQLYGLVNDEDWGDLRKFDININRVGTGKMDTEFTVTPKPHKALTANIEECLQMLEDKKLLDLQAIWRNEYPFLSYEW